MQQKPITVELLECKPGYLRLYNQKVKKNEKEWRTLTGFAKLKKRKTFKSTNVKKEKKYTMISESK